VPNRLDVCRCGAPRGDIQAVEVPSPGPAAIPQSSGPSDAAATKSLTGPARAVFLTIAAVAVIGVAGYSLIAPRSPAAAPSPAPAAVAAHAPPSAPVLPEFPPLDDAPPRAVPEAVAVKAEPMALLSTEEIVTRSMPAVVTVQTRDGLGSGFFVAAGTVITNAHVVRGNAAVTLKRGGGYSRAARVEDVWNDIDLALLKVDLPDLDQVALPLAALADVHVGAEVVAIGSPLGLANSVTRGIVSGMRDVEGVRMIQTDAAINPGNSGGPLLDRYGRVLGVNTMKLVTRGVDSLAFAVSIDYVRRMLGPSFVPKTDVDRQREDGMREYTQNLRVLADQADAVEANWKRFHISCGPEGGSELVERGWFELWDGRGAPMRATPSCRSWLGYFKDAAVRTHDALRRYELEARVAGVGVEQMRVVRRRNALVFAPWEP
jgi:S1-C subfamily serine protease